MRPGSCWESHLLPFKEVSERHLVWLYAPFMTADAPSHFGALEQALQVGVCICAAALLILWHDKMTLLCISWGQHNFCGLHRQASASD